MPLLSATLSSAVGLQRLSVGSAGLGDAGSANSNPDAPWSFVLQFGSLTWTVQGLPDRGSLVHARIHLHMMPRAHASPTFSASSWMSRPSIPWKTDGTCFLFCALPPKSITHAQCWRNVTQQPPSFEFQCNQSFNAFNPG